MDFFGGNNGTGAFAGQQPVPRLRLAFADITNGSTTIRIGQDWSPLFGNTAVSLSHIAFPLGYGSAGDVGWRFPGIFLTQVLTAKDSTINMDLRLAAMQNTWNTPGSTVDNTTPGNATAPQYELRFNIGGKMDKGTWSAYAVGHIDEKDLSGPGESAPNDKLTGSAVEIGAKVQWGPVLVQGNGYTGHAIGQQFDPQPVRPDPERGWLGPQVGFDFTPHWEIYGFGGLENPKDSEVGASPQFRRRAAGQRHVPAAPSAGVRGPSPPDSSTCTRS